MSINKELEKLYSKYWDDLIVNGKNITDKPANPFLLKIIDEDKYVRADLKVMIFGQETWEWNESFGKSIEEMMNHYECARETYLTAENKGFRYGFNFFKNKLIEHYKGKEIEFIWNNISKIGISNTTGVTKEIKELERNFFPVISEEMKILNPDIVIFLTGNRNDDIRFHFPDVTFAKYQNTATLLSQSGKTKFQPVYQVISEYLPNKSVKAYHPAAFRGAGFNNIKNDAIELLVDK